MEIRTLESSRTGSRVTLLRRRLVAAGVFSLLVGALGLVETPSTSAATGGLPSPTPEEALWYAVAGDMREYGEALRGTKTPENSKENLYQAKYIERLLDRGTTRAAVRETASTLCAKLAEGTGTNGVLRAAGHYMRTAPTGSLFPGHFPRSRAGLREEVDILLRRSAGSHAGFLCEDRAQDVDAVVAAWKGAAWAGNVAKRVARDVSLTMGKGISRGAVDEKAKTLLANALGRVCGKPVQTGDLNPCVLSGAPEGLGYSYGALERREVGAHWHGPDGIGCSAFVTLEARAKQRPAVVYGNVSCYAHQQ